MVSVALRWRFLGGSSSSSVSLGSVGWLASALFVWSITMVVWRLCLWVGGGASDVPVANMLVTLPVIIMCPMYCLKLVCMF